MAIEPVSGLDEADSRWDVRCVTRGVFIRIFGLDGEARHERCDDGSVKVDPLADSSNELFGLRVSQDGLRRIEFHEGAFDLLSAEEQDAVLGDGPGLKLPWPSTLRETRDVALREGFWKYADPEEIFATIPALVIHDRARSESDQTTESTRAGQPPPSKVAAVDAPANKVHLTTQKRRGFLAPIVDCARARVAESLDTATVWVALQTLAEEKASPLIGLTEEGIQYRRDGDVFIFTKKALDSHLRRLRPK